MAYCYNCGAQILDKAVVCVKCGAAVKPKAQVASEPNDDKVMRMLLPVGRSGLAIAAGYLGLFSVIPLLGIIALTVGLLAISDIKKHPEKHGLGRAWFGDIMGGVFT